MKWKKCCKVGQSEINQKGALLFGVCTFKFENAGKCGHVIKLIGLITLEDGTSGLVIEHNAIDAIQLGQQVNSLRLIQSTFQYIDFGKVNLL